MKLQPCPFCGSKKTNLADGSYTVDGTLIKTTNIICGNCNAMGPDTLLGEAVAAKKWNLRRLVSRRSSGSAWIALGDRQPKPGEWVLIVLELGSGCNFVVGMGWRKIHSDGSDTGWWDTNHGLVRDFLISHWQPTPPLPNSH